MMPPAFCFRPRNAMHLQDKHTGETARQTAASSPPFGPGFDPDVVAKTETLEVWASSFKDDGSDFCEFRALDQSGALIGRRRLAGY